MVYVIYTAWEDSEAIIKVTLSNVVGDTDNGDNKDILFVLKDVDGSIIFNKPDPRTISNIDGYHLVHNTSGKFEITYNLTSATVKLLNR